MGSIVRTSKLAGKFPSSVRIKIIQPPSFAPARLLASVMELRWYGDLLYTLTLHRIKIRYKQSRLGVAWAVLQPLSLTLVYSVIFSVFTKIPGQSAHYALFVLSGMLPWTFFQNSLSSSALGLVTNASLITKVSFPREIVPLSYVFTAMFDFSVASLVLVGMMVFYRIHVGIAVLYLAPILGIEILAAFAFSFLLSAMQVRFRDIGIAMPLILQLWMFCSPVVYSLGNVPHRFRILYVLNPMVGIIENFRRVVIQGVGADLKMLLVSGTVSTILLPLAYLYFKHSEATMADVI